MLLPAGHVLLDSDLACFEGIRVCADGMKVAGAPIGTDEYCAEFVGLKVDSTVAKIRALQGIHPQVGMLLLRQCCMPMLNYLAQVVPTSLTARHFARFDEQVANFVLELQTLPGQARSPHCPDARRGVFLRRLRLPLRLNGAGLVGVDSVGPAAFISSVIASAAADPILTRHITGLERFARPALQLLQARLLPLGSTRCNTLLRLPLACDIALFDHSRYVEPDTDHKTAPKLQWEWSQAVHVAAARTLGLEDEALGDCDFVHSQARARPAALILTLPLSNPHHRFTPGEFVAWFRFQFRIPQLARLGNADAEGVEQCLAGKCRRRGVDLHGNHANSGKCKSTLIGKGRRHRLMKYVVSYFATRAGCIVSWVTEESTPALLLRQFTPAECAAMFPVRPLADFASQAHQLAADTRDAAKRPPREREAARHELGARLRALRREVTDKKKGRGLRLDGVIVHPASGEEVWYDTTVTHTTTHTHLTAELKLTRERRAAGKEGAHMWSAGVLAANHTKLDRYALLAAITERQVLDGLRTAAPLILPVVVSTHGELCPGAVRLQEWLVEKYRARLQLEGDRDDGAEEADLTAAFRREFRASLTAAVAQGHSDMLTAAGLPFHRKQDRFPLSSARAEAGSRQDRPPPSGSVGDDDSAADEESTTNSDCSSDETVRSSRSSSGKRDGDRISRSDGMQLRSSRGARGGSACGIARGGRARGAAREAPPMPDSPGSPDTARSTRSSKDAHSSSSSSSSSSRSRSSSGSRMGFEVCDGFPIMS